MLTFKEMRTQGFITEALHKEIQDILDEPDSGGSKFRANKFNRVSKKVRDLGKIGEDSGLSDGKAKKGSSRAVYFPSEPKNVTIDDKPAKQHTAVKIAFHGMLDKHTGDDRLLGNLQNEAEGDQYLHQHHGILRETSDNHYQHNPNGVLMPVFDKHPDSDWLESAKASKLTKGKFSKLTANETHPKGLKFDDYKTALENSHKAAHGDGNADDGLDHVREHPFYRATEDYMHDSGMHPADLAMRNMGVYTHPHTGKEQVGITDAGYTNDIAKLYTKAWRNKSAKMNRY